MGIRVPDNQVARRLVELLGRPLLSTSLKQADDINPYPTDPELIAEEYEHQVNIVIDSGAGGEEPSTVVDCTADAGWQITRQGKGILMS